MRLLVNTQELNAAIATVTKALATKTTMSILEGIYMEAQDNQLMLRCTDLSLQIETVVPATVDDEGAIVLPGRLFSELIRRFPGELTNIETVGKTAALSSGRARTEMQGESSSDYHNMPDVKKEFEVRIKKSALKTMIRQCIFATASDDTKPMLTGVLLELLGDELIMVALDGYRLALRREKINDIGEEKHVVVPAKSLMEISRILDDSDDLVSIVFSNTHVLMDMGYTKIKTRLMEGEFIKYKQILPSGHTTRVRVSRSELYDSLERVSLMARESKSNLIKFTFADSMLSLSANSEIGSSNEDLDVNIMGSDLEIAFNGRYYSDVLKALDDEEIFLDMNSNISPCVIRPVQGERFYYLVLPVRLFNG